MLTVQIGEVASYTAAGVNVHDGDHISDMWFEATVRTQHNRDGRLGQMAVSAGSFSGVRGLDMDLIQGHRGLVQVGAVDGAGTKPDIAERAKAIWDSNNVISVYEEQRDHRGIPQDVAAMCLDDLARDGVEPYALFILYDTSSLSHLQTSEVTQQLAEGSVEAASLGDVIFLGGESADLGSRVGGYGEFNYNIGGFALGMGLKDRILTGEKVQPRDKIVALRDKNEANRGFRSNGFSLVRKVLEAEYGEDWHVAVQQDDPNFLNRLLVPSTIFTRTLVDMHGGYDYKRDPKLELHGVAHITGGGLPGKLQRVLAVNGLGAVLGDVYEPPESMSRIQELSLRHEKFRTPDASAYQALNMGNEMLVIVPEAEADETVRVAGVNGQEGRVVGEIVPKSGIEVLSRGKTNPGEWIRFEPKAA